MQDVSEFIVLLNACHRRFILEKQRRKENINIIHHIRLLMANAKLMSYRLLCVLSTLWYRVSKTPSKVLFSAGCSLVLFSKILIR